MHSVRSLALAILLLPLLTGGCAINFSGDSSGGGTIAFQGLTRAWAAGDHAMNLRWAAGVGAVKYRVYAAGALDKVLGETTDTYYLLMGLATGTSYTFIVRGVAQDGTEDTNTNAVTAKTLTYDVPDFSGLLSAKASGVTSVDLTWPMPSGNFTGFKIFQATVPESQTFQSPVATVLASAPVTDTDAGLIYSTTLTGLSPGTAYYFVARAYYIDSGNREFIDLNYNEKSATTLPLDSSWPAPTITSVTPSVGPLTGGTPITITGTSFLPGGSVTLVLGGQSYPCTSVSFPSTTQINCTTPPSTPASGWADIQVVNTQPTTQNGSLTHAFLYTSAPAPNISGINLPYGPTAGNLSVSVSGSNFVAGATVALGSSPCSVTSTSPTQIVCTTGSHAAALVDAVVTNPDSQTALLSAAYLYTGPPTVTSLSPAIGSSGGNTIATVYGTGFTSGASVTFGSSLQSPVPCNSVFVESATKIVCSTSSHADGFVRVSVTNPDGQTGMLDNAYQYTSVPGPTVSSISPAGGPLGGGTAVSILGSNFLAASAVTIGGNPCGSLTVVSGNQITCTTPASATSGGKNVVVTNPDGQAATIIAGFNYSTFPPPFLGSITPSIGPTAGGTLVTINGTGFQSGATVKIGTVPCSTVSFLSSSSVRCTTGPNSTGPYTVTLTNADGQEGTLFNGFHATDTGPPTVTSVAPSHGPTAGGTSLTVTGTGFQTGASVLVGAVPCTSAVVSSLTSLTCTSGGNSRGSYTLKVTNPDTQSASLANAFFHTDDVPPTVASISPSHGPTAGGTLVTITGTGFQSGATVAIGATTCASPAVSSSTSMSCTAGPNPRGPYALKVTNPDTQFSSLAAAFFHTDDPAPTIASVTPNFGPTAGNTIVTLNGANFQNGATITVGGSPCTTVGFVSAGQLTCHTPAGSTGAVTVKVTNPDYQTVSFVNGFYYTDAAAPTLTSVSPNFGPTAGNTTLTLIGTNFQNGSTVSVGGGACTSVTFVSANQLTCQTPAGSTGAVTVTVNAPDYQTASIVNGFYYTNAAAPTVASVSPNFGPTAGNTTITVNGANFQNGATVTVGGIACTTVTFVSASQLTCHTPAGSTGAVTVKVTNADYQTVSFVNGFYYTNAATPTLASVSPNFGPTAGNTTITLNGTNFQNGATVTVGGIACTTVTFVSASQLTCHTPAGSTGAVTVTVTDPDYQTVSIVNGFYYTNATAPTLTSVSPNFGPTAGNTVLTVNGTNFQNGATVTVGGNACTSVTFVSASQLTCHTPAGSTGAVTVKVTNADYQTVSLAGAFYYTDAAAPTFTSVSPNFGPTAGNTTITLNGTNFQNGATVTVGGSPCTTVGFVSAGQLTCHTPAASTGAVTVTVTDPDYQTVSIVNGFYYTNAAAPTLTSVSPNFGPTAGNTTITLNGTNFQNGVTVTVAGSACTSVAFVSASQLTCQTPAGSTGAVTVKVTNPDYQTASLASAFYYTDAAAPTLTSVSPNFGPTAGNTTITVNGANFQNGATVTVGGIACTTVTFVSASQLTCHTPAGSTGAVTLQMTNADYQTVSLAAAFYYTNAAAPTLTSVSPNFGPTAGNTTITLNGTNFQNGATVTVGGIACTTVTFVSASQLTCHTPAGSTGAVTVTVTDPDYQTVSIVNGFYYTNAAAPTLTSVSPNFGPTAGNTTITLNGTNFQNGATVTVGGIACTTVTFVNTSQLTCHTPAGSTGAATVIVTNADYQTVSFVNGFYYTNAAAPTLTSVSPNFGATAGNTTITLNGTNFQNGATVTVGGVACTTVTFVSASQLTCHTPAGSTGAVTVTVTDPDYQTVSIVNGFYYTNAAAPTLTSVSPNFGATAGNTTITLNGTNFQNGATVTVGGIACTTVTFVNASQLTCHTPAGSTGAVTVQVTNADYQTVSLAAAFYYTNAAAPTLTSVSPNFGATAGNTTITLNGTNFQNGATVTVGGVACTTVTFVSASQLTCHTPAGSTGAVTVTVTDPDYQTVSIVNGFYYTNAAAPTLTSVSPNFGATAGNTTITLNGTNFQNGATVTVGGVACTTVTFVSASQLTCHTPAGSTGAVTVTVTDPDYQTVSIVNGFYYTNAAAPTLTSVSPNFGPTAGNTTITLNGTNFQNGATVTVGGIACTTVTFVNASQLTCHTPAGSTGAVTVQVTNADYQTVSLAAAFYYTNAPAPTISSLSPVYGPPAGNTTLTVNGTNFQNGATVTVAGSACTTVTFVSASQLTCHTPAGSTGDVTVQVTNADYQTVSLANGFFYTGTPTVTAISPSAVNYRTGGSVTITGTNFINGATVTLGTSCGSVSFVNHTQLTCTATSHAEATVDVAVNNPNSQTGTLTNGFAYQRGPYIAHITPDSNLSTSGGTVISLYGSNFLAGLSVTVGGVPCQSLSLVSSTHVDCTTPALSAGDVDVNVANTDGQVYLASRAVRVGSAFGGFGNVVQFAGTVSRQGPDDGVGTAARLFAPAGLILSGSPLYVADTNNCLIRKIDLSTNTVSTDAGKSPKNCNAAANGIGAAAGLTGATAMTLLSSLIYFTEAGHVVRSYDPSTKTVTTVAGTAFASGTTDASGAAARFNGPKGIATDGTYLYVADSSNHTIRKIDPSGWAVTTIAGTAGSSGTTDATGSAARFNGPRGLAYNGGLLYVADTGNNSIRSVDLTTFAVTTVAGSTAGTAGDSDLLGTAARLTAPNGLVVLNISGTNYVYIAATGNNKLKQYNLSTTQVTSVAGSVTAGWTDANAGSARFNSPAGLATDGSVIYISETSNHSVRKYDPATGNVTTIAGGFNDVAGNTDATGTTARLTGALGGIATIGTTLYGGQSDGRIRVVNPSSAAVTTLANVGSPIFGATSDGVDLFVTTATTILQVNSSTGSFTTLASGLTAARGLTTDGRYLYFSEQTNHVIRQVEISTGTLTTIAGLSGTSGYVDATGSAARFSSPTGLTTDGIYLYVADKGNSKVRKIDLGAYGATTFATLSSVNDLIKGGDSLYAENNAFGSSLTRISLANGSTTTTFFSSKGYDLDGVVPGNGGDSLSPGALDWYGFQLFFSNGTTGIRRLY